MRIRDLKRGRRYLVRRVTGGAEERRRLLDMGVTGGTVITVLHIAPFGGTALFELRGFMLALRENALKLLDIIEYSGAGADSRVDTGYVRHDRLGYVRGCTRPHRLAACCPSEPRSLPPIVNEESRRDVKKYDIYLAGNANVGKTTLYNRLTKSSEHIGNWHGVTVDARKKTVSRGGTEITLTDIPGMYGLTASSAEEEVSRDVLYAAMNGGGVVVCVCEVNNLARNLCLALQLIELKIPLVIAVNMADELKTKYVSLDTEKLSRALGVPVVLTSAKYNRDTVKLLDTAVAEAERAWRPDYGAVLSARRERLLYLKRLPVGGIARIISRARPERVPDTEFCAVKLIEEDSFIRGKLQLSAADSAAVDALLKRTGDGMGETARLRFEYLDGLMSEVAVYKAGSAAGKGVGRANRLDRLLLNKYLALPLFICIMSAVFFLTFGLIGRWMTDGLRWLIARAGGGLFAWLTRAGAPAWVIGLVCDGVVGGVGTVLTFLPQITLLFLFLAFLEDTGYLSRVAFMTDGLFRKAGLSGRSVFTLLMGFGCSATAVMTARNLESEPLRKKTILLTPFMSCSARLPVYSVIAGAFFFNRWLLIFALYLLGAAVALLLSKVLEIIPALRAPEPAFIMEMPPYRLPALSRVLRVIGKNIAVFLTRVATVVFGLSVIVWILSNFTFSFRYVPEAGGYSIMEFLAGGIAWALWPLGFGNWRAMAALISGFVAKESVIVALQQLAGQEPLAAMLGSPEAALSFAVFVLLYVPCLSTVGAIREEIGAKWMWFSIFLQLGVAYIASLTVYWTGRLLSCGNTALIAGVFSALTAALICFFTARRLLKRKKCTACGMKKCGECFSVR